MEVIIVNAAASSPAVASPVISLTAHPDPDDEGFSWQGTGDGTDPLQIVIDCSSGMNTTTGNAGPHNLSALRGAQIGTGANGFTGAISNTEEAAYAPGGQLNYADEDSWIAESSPTDLFLFKLTFSGGTPFTDGRAEWYQIHISAEQISDGTSTYECFHSGTNTSPGGESLKNWDSEITPGSVWTYSAGNFDKDTEYKVGSWEQVYGSSGYFADIKIPDIIHIHPDNDSSCDKVARWLISIRCLDANAQDDWFYTEITCAHSDA